jgi:hypothetical protein
MEIFMRKSGSENIRSRPGRNTFIVFCLAKLAALTKPSGIEAGGQRQNQDACNCPCAAESFWEDSFMAGREATRWTKHRQNFFTPSVPDCLFWEFGHIGSG